MAMPPPDELNFSRHLLQINAGRSQNLAFVDDLTEIRYGDLSERIKLFGSGLRAHGLKRGERILLVIVSDSFCSDRWQLAQQFRKIRYGLGGQPLQFLRPAIEMNNLIFRHTRQANLPERRGVGGPAHAQNRDDP